MEEQTLFGKRRIEGSPYWVMVRFDLKEPLVVQRDPGAPTSSSGVAVGFYQNLGITAASAEAAWPSLLPRSPRHRQGGLW